MSHEVETMAYNAVEKPWHGLGVPVPENISVDDMVIAAGLDSEYAALPSYIWDPRADPPRLMQVADVVEIYRLKDMRRYAQMSADYQVIQPRTVMEVFREYVDAGKMTLETAGSLKNGALIWALAKLNQSYTLPGNDRTERYIMLYNSYDGSRAYEGLGTDIRVVCMNTFRAALSAATKLFKQKHTAKLDTDNIRRAAIRDFQQLSTQTAQIEESANKLAATYLDEQESYRYIAQLVQPELLEASYIEPLKFDKPARDIRLAMLTSPGSDLASAKNTAWGAFNGVTYYVDHQMGRERSTALYAAWFGAGAKLKDAAWKLAVKTSER